MKSTESVKNYPSEVRLYTNYAIKNIKYICKNYGPRPVGSEKEKDAREYLAKELETTCDSVMSEEFRCSDKAFMSWPVVGAVLLTAACAFLTFGLSVVSAVLCVLTIFAVLAEAVFYKPVIDLFFPKKTSANVIGVRKSGGEATRRIVLTGHIDSSYEWTYAFRGGAPVFRLIIINFILSAVFISASCVYSFFSESGFIWSGGDVTMKVLICLCYATVPGLIAALFFTNFKNPVTGANDNLSGCMLSAAVLKYMEANKIRLENTEIVVALTSGGEAGLKGAKAWAKAHAKEIKAENGINTVFLAIDTIRDFDYMAIHNKDMSGVVKNDPRAVELVRQAAENVGFDIPLRPVKHGSTDAAAFSQAGLAAAAVTATDPSLAKYFHTRLDTEDNLDPKSLETGLKIALETVYLFDEQGI